MSEAATNGAPAKAAEPAKVAEAPKAPPPKAPADASASAPPPSPRVKIGAEEVDPVAFINELREAIGEENLPNVRNLSKIVRQKVGQLGAKEREIVTFLQETEDPKKLLAGLSRRLGSPEKARALIEEAYALDIEERNTPEDKRVESRIEKLKREEQELLQRQRDRQTQQEAATFQRSFGSAFKAELAAVGVAPKDPRMLARLVAEMAGHVGGELGNVSLDEQGRLRLSEEQRLLLREAASAVGAWYRDGSAEAFGDLPGEKRTEIVKTSLKSLDGEGLYNLLGEELMRKLRAYDLARVKARNGNGQFQQGTREQPPPPSSPRRKMNMDEFLESVRGKR